MDEQELLIARERPQRTLVPTPRLAEQHQETVGELGGFDEERPAREGIRVRFGNWLRAADPREIEGSKTPLMVLALLGMLASWDFNATGVLTFEMRADFGFDLGFIASMLAVVGIFGTLMAPMLGYLVDHFNRVWFLRIAAFLGMLAAAGTALSDSLVPLMITRAIGAATLGIQGAIGAPSFPLISDWYPSRVRARAFAVLNVATILGAILGPIVGGALAAAYGWRSAYAVLAVMLFVGVLATFRLREPPRGYMDRLESGASEESAARPQRALGWSEAWRSARSIVTLRRLWYAIPFTYIGGAGALFTAAALFTDVFHFGATQRGILAASGQAAGLVLLISVAPALDRLLARSPGSALRFMAVFPFVQAGLFLLLAFSGIAQLSIVASIMLAMIGAVNGVAFFTFMSLVTPARVRGLGLQIGNLWQLPGQILVPVILSFVIQWDVRRGMLVFAPLLVIGALIVLSGVGGFARDMRAARAAAMADEVAERSRREKRDQMLIIRDVDVTYDGTQVLFGVDLDIGSGEIVSLLGTNGAGKSTLLRAIIGIQEASSGAILVDGQDITHAPPHENARRGIVMVPGGHAVFPSLTVNDNLATAARAVDVGDSAARIDEVLDLFPALRARRHELAGNLSGGEQQMLAMGQAFLSRPRLLMIDELSLGLAPALVEQLIGIVRKIHAQGTTVILVEQSINIALTIAERAVFMEKGQVRFDGPATELMRRPDLIRSVFMGGALGGAPGRGPRARSRIEREVVVRAEGIAVRFGGVEAVRNASIEASAGEVVGIIGPNGAGKTTLFDVIAGGTQPDTGRVLLMGQDVTLMPAYERARAGLGRSFQTARLFGSLTVRECIAVALERHVRVASPILYAAWAPRARADERRLQRRVQGLIRLLGLTTYADKFVSELSTGTRRAVDIACIMAAEPAVVLLDEPTSGLAQAEAEALAPLLTRLVRDSGCALVVIEHDLPMIASIADRLVAMDVGEVVADGPPHEVLSNEYVLRSYLAATDEVIKRSDLQMLTKR